MFPPGSIRRVHLEVTSACNARCPQCARNLDGGPALPGLPVTQLRLADVRAIFPADFLRRLRAVRLCGNYGDPALAADLLPICAHFKAANPALRVGLHTNGGVRPPGWWRELAGCVDFARFGIDGLADTNHLHRRGVDWAPLMENVRAFLGAGGRGEWDFLVFRHNEHQVEAARALAAELGFAQFTAKRTRRFLREGRRTDRQPVRSPRDGAVEFFLEEPRDPAWRNEAVHAAAAEWSSPEEYARYLGATPIACRAAAQREIYVSAQGEVFPCCWLAQVQGDAPGEDARQTIALLGATAGGRRSLDGRAQPAESIAAGPFFRAVAAGWTADPGEGATRLRTCAKQCGAHDFFAAQFAVRPEM